MSFNNLLAPLHISPWLSNEFSNWISGYPSLERWTQKRIIRSPPFHHFSSSSSFTLPYYFIFLKTRADKTAAIAGFHAAFPPAVLARSTTVFSRLYADRRTHRYASVHVPAEVASSLRVSKVHPATPQFEHTFFRLVRAACCEHLYPKQDVWNVWSNVQESIRIGNLFEQPMVRCSSWSFDGSFFQGCCFKKLVTNREINWCFYELHGFIARIDDEGLIFLHDKSFIFAGFPRKDARVAGKRNFAK